MLTNGLSARQKEILALLSKETSMDLNELAQQVQVSGSTLRRDLRNLAEAGLIQRSFGKVGMAQTSDVEKPFMLRLMDHEEEKRRIARAALALLRNGETIFISGGSTTLEFSRLLPGQRRVNVFTNAIPVANAVVDRPGINLVVLGGEVRSGEQTMHGHLTLYGIQQLRADKLFYGIEAIHPVHGLTHSHLLEVSTDRGLIGGAVRTIVLADHSKLNKVAPALVVPVNKVHTIITGREAPAEVVEELLACKVEVIQA